jgi:hypothetical protein
MFGIFGLGDGKMDLQLKNVNVAPGDTLEGTASLTMKKDVMGKEVVAILYAEETVTERPPNPKGNLTTRQITLYSKSEILDAEKLYTTANSPYQYKFAFVIPQTGASSTHATSISVGMISNLFRSGGIVRWYVKAELKHEAALKFPVAKTQEINIVARSDVQVDAGRTFTVSPESPMQSGRPATVPLGENRFCASCGTQLSPEAAFCSKCGAKQ